ncbi:two-component system sensor histidine kinase BaeS [Sphaerotilus hippei]|uniref:histidine kinase n=1 Tax=Sphaerotilus hippei TaxID=744406 RepID=A0A318HA88_9BURK|nr:ATP-binding protein [Sphaerotilus hippei]PXW97402.1 two-component system sensor histidine kinase BaeS [Sphaerotilus hippei]
MKIGISTRLFAAVLTTAVLVVGVVGGLTHRSFTRGFLGYLNDVAAERLEFVGPRLARAYVRHGSWEFLRNEPRAWFGLLRPVVGDELPANAPVRPGMPLTSDLTGAVQRLGLLDTQQQWVAGYRDLDASMLRQPIQVDGRTVGWLVLAPFQSVADGGARRFQEGQREASIATAALALALAALIAWWASRRLAAPVRQVAAATHRLAAGHHDTRVDVDSPDEVGQLAHDFNHLARTLERNEALRREFMADVSHELRTPLAVLRGELEALEDGIRPFDRAAVGSLQAEVRQLGQLVDDLYELALSDAGALSYRFGALDLGVLLRRVVEAHRHRTEQRGLELTLQCPEGPLTVPADEGRLQQLFDNLLENSRRYTDAPGRIRIEVQPDGACWQVDLHDTAPGVPADTLPQLFERFFRVDGSRSRSTGGAGLGLAICRNIVLAHGGEIVARASPLGGVWISIRLPAA